MANDLEIQGAIKRTKKGTVDWYEGGGEEAWQSLETALQNIPDAVRVGKTIKVWVNGVIREYWWPTTDITDSDIRVKMSPVSDIPAENGTDAFSTGGAYNKFAEIDTKIEELEVVATKVSTTRSLQYVVSGNSTNTLTITQLIGKKVLAIFRGLPLHIVELNTPSVSQCKFTSSTGTILFGANLNNEELITVLYTDVVQSDEPTIRYISYLDDSVILDEYVYLTSDTSGTPSTITNLTDQQILTDSSILG